MAEGKPEHVLEFHTHKADLQECVFAGLPFDSKDVALMTPLRETRSLPRSTALANSTNIELPKVVVGNALTKGKVMFQAMISSMNQRFTAENFSEIKEREQAASLFPLLNAAKVAANEDEFLTSEPVRLLLSKHPDYVEGARNLSINIFRNRDTDMLKKCCSEIELYHCVFTTTISVLNTSLAKLPKFIAAVPQRASLKAWEVLLKKFEMFVVIRKHQRIKKTSKTLAMSLSFIGTDHT